LPRGPSKYATPTSNSYGTFSEVLLQQHNNVLRLKTACYDVHPGDDTMTIIAYSTRSEGFSAACIGLSRSKPLQAAHPARLRASQAPLPCKRPDTVVQSAVRQPIGLFQSALSRFRAPGWFLRSPRSWHIPVCRRRHAVVSSCDVENLDDTYE
jgi:hypothetical protein